MTGPTGGGSRLLVALAVVVGAWAVAAPAARARTQCPEAATNRFEVLEIEMLEAQLTPVDFPATQLERYVVWGEPERVTFRHVVEMDRDFYAVAWQQCLRRHCRGYVALASRRGGRFKLVERSLLPHWYDADEDNGVEVQHVGLFDVDGNGTRELLVQYRVNEIHRPGTGQRYRQVMGIWDPRELRLLWIYEVGKGGDGRNDPHCDGVLVMKDVNCDKHGDLVMHRVCAPEFCFREEREHAACRKPEEHMTAFRWRDDSELFVGYSDEDRLLPYDDALNWLVVAGTFAVAATDFDERAAEHRDKLVAAGFKDATVYNTRVFRRLDCCYRNVVVGRFKTKEEAEKLMAKVKAKGFRTYVRRGF